MVMTEREQYWQRPEAAAPHRPAHAAYAPQPTGQTPAGQTASWQPPAPRSAPLPGYPATGYPAPAPTTDFLPGGGYRPVGGYPPSGGGGYPPTASFPTPGYPAPGQRGPYPTVAPVAPARPGATGRRLAIAAGLLALTLTSATVGGVAAVGLTDHGSTTANGPAVRTVNATGTLPDVVAAVAPTVVTINVALRGGAGTGSGVVIGTDGTVLTNAHVVAQATAITVHFADGHQAAARLVGADAAKDVAVVRVAEPGAITAAVLGVGTELRVGESVLAFGSPLGLDGSVSAGIVSALNRSVEGEESSLTGMIQTDAAINPGNSGGPLVNAAGQVVGIDTAIATTNGSGGNIGVGFAIPITTAKQVADKILNR
jgi:putative serine protease PepD